MKTTKRKQRLTLLVLRDAQHSVKQIRRLGTVSTPLTWDEVRQNVAPTEFHLLNIEERLREKGDLLQSLPPQPIENVIRHLKPPGKGSSKRKG